MASRSRSSSSSPMVDLTAEDNESPRTHAMEDEQQQQQQRREEDGQEEQEQASQPSRRLKPEEADQPAGRGSRPSVDRDMDMAGQQQHAPAAASASAAAAAPAAPSDDASMDLNASRDFPAQRQPSPFDSASSSASSSSAAAAASAASSSASAAAPPLPAQVHARPAAAAAAAAEADAPLLALPAMRVLPPVKLGKTSRERTLFEHLGDLYSLLVTMDHIEKAYVRDAISEHDYTATCSKLIAQYKTMRESLGDQAPDLDNFCRDYGLESRAAVNRFKVGVPATVVHGAGGGGGGGAPGAAGGAGGGNNKELAVFHAVQHFITVMDSLKLNMRAVDELHPTLSELVESMARVPLLPSSHDSRTKTLHWLTTLHAMKAHEQLSDEQVRQMSFDLDFAYNAFHRFVKGH